MSTDYYPRKAEVQYHIFTDGSDDYVIGESVEMVLAMVQELIDEGYENIRVYKDTEWNDEDGVFLDGDCIFSLGSWPT